MILFTAPGTSGQTRPSTWRDLPHSSVSSSGERIVKMASFYNLLSFMAVNGFEYSNPSSFDLITSLPLEMAIAIMR